MPIYEYHCTLCDESTEILQKMSDAPATTCPHCHKEGLTKQISSPSFHLKGTGWYATDFKEKPKSTTTTADTSATTAPAAEPKSTEVTTKTVETKS